MMKISETTLPGVLLVDVQVFTDARGSFMETWHSERYAEGGVPPHFVQDNLSFSRHGVLRGLHFQHPHGQGKLVYVLQGEIFDVAVDIRIGSPTFGQWVGVPLSEKNHQQLYVPDGFAHGFCVVSPTAMVAYKCTDIYRPQTEGGVLWNDPELNIQWPISQPNLSPKDASYPLLRDIDPARLPQYR